MTAVRGRQQPIRVPRALSAEEGGNDSEWRITKVMSEATRYGATHRCRIYLVVLSCLLGDCAEPGSLAARSPVTSCEEAQPRLQNAFSVCCIQLILWIKA